MNWLPSFMLSMSSSVGRRPGQVGPPEDDPLELDAPLEPDAPLELDAPLEPDAPLELDAPLEPDAPLELDDPLELDAPLEPDDPPPLDDPPVPEDPPDPEDPPKLPPELFEPPSPPELDPAPTPSPGPVNVRAPQPASSAMTVHAASWAILAGTPPAAGLTEIVFTACSSNESLGQRCLSVIVCPASPSATPAVVTNQRPGRLARPT
jgi:hypothetical protein